MNQISCALEARVHILRQTGDISLLRITTEQKRGKLVLSVEGRLAGQWVAALEQCWRDLRASSPGGKFSINLCGVSFIDAAGKVLLKEIHSQGGHLLAEGCLNQAIVREIAGERGAEKSGAESEEAPKSKKKSHIIFYLIFFRLLPCAAAGAYSERASTDGQLRDPIPHGALSARRADGRTTAHLESSRQPGLEAESDGTDCPDSGPESVQDKNVARAALLPEVDGSVNEEVQRDKHPGAIRR